MKRIQKKLTFEEFIDVCTSKNIKNRREIMKRWDNYLMFKETTKDGRSDFEVGANVKEEDLNND